MSEKLEVGVVTQGEPDLSWFDIAVDKRGNVFILDYAPGWEDFDIEVHWEDTFQIDSPSHLAAGAYRFSGYTVGSWDVDEGIDITGGTFAHSQAVGVFDDSTPKSSVLADLKALSQDGYATDWQRGVAASALALFATHPTQKAQGDE